MKTERRHELQHNVLADWLADAGAKVEPYSRAIWATIIGILVIAALAIYLVRQRSANREQEWELYYGGIDALSQGEVTNMADVAERLGDTPAGLWAHLQLADAYLTQAVDNEFRDRASSDVDLDRSIEAYKFVRDNAEQSDLLERATLGLARAYESHFKLAEAKAEYEAVVKNWPDGECAAEAKERLADLNRPSTVAFYDWFARQNPAPSLQNEPGIPGQMPMFDQSALPGDSPFGDSPFGAPAGSQGASSPAGVPGEFEPLFPELKMRDATEPPAGASDAAGESAPATESTPSSEAPASDPSATSTEPATTSEPSSSSGQPEAGASSSAAGSDQAGQPASETAPQQSDAGGASTEPADAGEPKAQP